MHTAALQKIRNKKLRAPARRGYQMPAEWKKHRRTWIAWPHNRKDWPGKFAPIRWVYEEFVRILTRSETVAILVCDHRHLTAVRHCLTRAHVDLNHVEFHRCRTDRSWVRDSGPIFVSDGENVLATLWRFNAWAKYPNFKRDAKVGKSIAKFAHIPTHRVRHRGLNVVLEGGAIDVDGAGRLIATEECLLSSEYARNPSIPRHEMEAILRSTLGVTSVIWLGRGIDGDDTHGHVDDITRFVAPGHVVTARERNSRDPNYAPLEENFERLRGASLEIIEMPMPSPIVFDGQRVPASYMNFYIGYETIVVPTFNDPKDYEALGILRELFSPNREVVGINATDLIWGLGTFHCMTQQEPEP